MRALAHPSEMQRWVLPSEQPSAWRWVRSLQARSRSSGASTRIRELEQLAQTLNRRLLEANQRAGTAESDAAQVIMGPPRS